MRDLSLPQVNSVLCLGAHADDIEIGCGGTLLQVIQRNPQVHCHWVVFSADGPRRSEAQRSAEAFLDGCHNATIDVWEFRDAYFPASWATLKDRFRGLSEICNPDLVLTHRLEDRHQDHRVISELTWNHFRRHLILEYEIPKYEGDLTTPSVYVPLAADVVASKVAMLLQYFPSQQDKSWFDAETFEGLMRIRGLESGAPSRFAEAFSARKLCLQI